MPTEEQELRLRVVLDDQASAQIAALKANIMQLTSGQAAASMEKFKKGQQEIGEGIKKLTELATGGERAMLSFIGKFGGLGVAAAGLGTVLTSTALKLADLSDKAKLSGIEPARLKNFVDQLEKAGVASDVAADSAGRFAGALADLSRFGSARYQALINMAGTHKAEMIAGIKEVERAATIEEKFNKARELAENVQKYRYDEDIRRGKDRTTAEADSFKARREFYQKLTDMDPSTLLLRNMENLTAEEKKRNEALLENARKVKTTLDELKKSTELVGEELVKAFGPTLNKILKQDTEDIKSMVKGLEDFEAWWRRFSTEKTASKSGVAPPHTFSDLLFGPGTGAAAEAQRQQGLDKLRSGQGTRLAPEGSSVGPGTGKGATEAPPPQGGSAPAGAAGPASAGGGTRGDRNNNPGNLKFGPHAQAFGAVSADERGFAIFPNRESGEAAQETLIKSNRYSGLTLQQFAGKYAEGSQDWTGTVGRELGIKPGDIVNNQDPRLPAAIRRAEGTAAPAPPTAAQQGEPGAVPAAIIAQAHKVALEGGPGAVGQFMAQQGYPKNGAWCGEFAASVVKSVGGTPPQNPQVATNWRKWGAAVDAPQPGDIAIRKRSRFGGGYTPTGETGSHVTFVERVDPTTGRFIGVGGNQGRPERDFPVAGYEYRRAGQQEDNRRALDDKANREHTVTGSATLKADINAPPGTKVAVGADGLFKKTVVTRQTQMAPAADGPEAVGGP